MELLNRAGGIGARDLGQRALSAANAHVGGLGPWQAPRTHPRSSRRGAQPEAAEMVPLDRALFVVARNHLAVALLAAHAHRLSRQYEAREAERALHGLAARVQAGHEVQRQCLRPLC